MDIESRFAEIAKDAADYGGRIMFGPKLEALLRFWYMIGIADASGVVRTGPNELQVLDRSKQP